MSDPKQELQASFQPGQRFANYGDLILRLHIKGFRNHANTFIDIESPVTAFCGVNGTGKSTKPVFKQKRAITSAEHAAIVARELNPERRDFYELLWHTGASQTDAACLTAEDVNWSTRTISYCRKKLKSRNGVKPALIRFGEEVAAILKRRPQSGPLFIYLCTVRAGDRATEFKQRCDGLKIKGISLHSYRYAWAERALQCGYPERFAQQALGHNSKAVHHAYSKHAEVTVPCLDDWEKQYKQNPQGLEKPKVVAVDFHAAAGSATAAVAEPAITALERAG